MHPSERNSVYIIYYNSSTKTPYLVKLNRDNGSPVATRTFSSIPASIFRVPSIASDGTVYLQIYSTLYALNSDNISGTPRWTRNIAFTNTPAIGKDGTLYVTYWQDISGTWYNNLAALDPANGSEKYSISFPLNINTDDIFQPYVANNGVVVFTIESSGPNYTVSAYEDTGSRFQSLWNYYAGTSGGDFAFGPGSTIYLWGKTGLANTLYAISGGNVGDPYGLAMAFTDNNPPNIPSNPNPSDGGIVSGTSTTLSWTASDPDGHSLKYDIYIGTYKQDEEGAFGPAATEITTNSYNLTGLWPGVKYQWSAIATDGQSINRGPNWAYWVFT